MIEYPLNIKLASDDSNGLSLCLRAHVYVSMYKKRLYFFFLCKKLNHEMYKE